MMGSLEIIAKRVFTYLLRRCFGQYLETFTHDELYIDYNKGKAVVENVALKVEALNSVIEDYNLPFEILHGQIDEVLFEVPWTAPFTENSVIEFHGVKLTVQPKKCADDASMFASMFESMASSLQLAEECLQYKLENDADFETPTESVDTIVRAIDTVFSKMKIKFVDTVIRIESVLEDGVTGVALEIKIKSADCFDEAGVESCTNRNTNSAERNTYQASAYSVKKCIFEGISLYTVQFPASLREANQDYSSAVLTAGSPDMPPQHCSLITPKEDKVLQTKPVLISRIPGQQQLRLKLKQDDSVVGPKVDIEISLGAFNLFLSPYQVFMLIELTNGLAKPGSAAKNSSHGYCPKTTNRPMRESDFAQIEQEISRQREQLHIQSKSLQHQCGWSSNLDDSEEERFHLMKEENKPTTEVPLITEDLESSCSSIGSEKLFSGPNIQTLLSDPLTESTQIHLSCSTLCVILLHDQRWAEDPSNIHHNFSHDGKSSLDFNSLGSIAETYFDDLSAAAMEGLNFKDFSTTTVRDKVSKLTKANHLRFVASGATLAVNEKTSSLQKVFATSLTLSDLEILECLFNATNENPSKEPTHMPLMSFKHENLPECSQRSDFKEPVLKIKYEQYDYGAQFRSLKHPANKLIFRLAPVALDIDISLLDRIQSLLNPDLSFIRRSKKQESFQFSWRDDNDLHSDSPPKTEVQFSSPFALINLRFPIPDLRPYIDRMPWWKQNLRDETLMMELMDASLSFILDPEQTEQKFELQCRDFHGMFKISPNEEPVSFIRVSVDPEADKIHSNNCPDWPRLVIRKIPQSTFLYTGSAMHAEHEENFFTSLNPEAALQSLMANMKKAPSPFSNSSVAFGSKLAPNSSTSDQQNNCALHDEIVAPAEKEKILEFIDQIVNRSQYVFNFSLPTVNIILPDKKFFEILYNRLGSDLILWENAPMTSVGSRDVNSPSSALLDFDLQPLKDYPKSGSAYNDSNSDSDEDTPTFHSVSDFSIRRNEMPKDSSDDHKLTKLSILLNIDKGSMTIHTPLRDTSKNILPDDCGRMQLCIEDCKFFIASSYKGNPDESYICLLSNKGYLYHDKSIPILPGKFTVQPYVSQKNQSNGLIIYPSEPGVPGKSGVTIGKGRGSIDVLSIAVHVLADVKQKMKTFKMAIGICGSTLRHYMSTSPELWLNQFTDFVNVEDQPILGYEPSSVIVEFHLHLMNCGIDYRPLYLPLKTFLTLENFSLSTNITASTDSSLLRIISEELCLFLSNEAKTRAVDLKKDYVCVVDTGLVDLSVRYTDHGKLPGPKFEISATNNMINVHTCADSCQALQKFIVYLATYGDFPREPSPPIDPSENVVKKEEAPVLETHPSEKVRNLMAEAMKDLPSSKIGSRSDQSDSEVTDSSEDSYVILEDVVGVGVLPKNKEVAIRLLTDEPIVVDYNYIKLPSVKASCLDAPKHFPEPNVCHNFEMSIIWHLYGGNDFNIPKGPEKKRVRINSTPGGKDGNLNDIRYEDSKNVKIDTDKNTISFCKVTPLTKEFNINAVHFSMEHVSLDQQNRENAARSWILKGGDGRDHNILMELQMDKIKIRHEEYPEITRYASRDVLAIYDIEVRDKLADSDFNKFLYQYSSESMPRQTHADMLLIKTLKVRSQPRPEASKECSVKVSCMPLRFNIDQDALIFLQDFFKASFGEENNSNAQSNTDGHLPSPRHSPPPSVVSQDNGDDSPTFFKSFVFEPAVPIRFDYQGKRVMSDLGACHGFLMAFTQMNCSQITLKSLSHKYGLLGYDKLLNYAFEEWLRDIKHTQIPGVLSGVGPMRSFVQLFQGLKDFFWFPVAQYRKDGQIVRGFQRGASSFSTSTAAAFLELTSQFVGLIQNAAVCAYDIVSPGPSVADQRQSGNLNQIRRPSQPADIKEGMASAYNIVKAGFDETARRIIMTAAMEHEHKGVPGAIGSVLRQIPPAAMKPIILGAEATCIVLGGAKHQLDPDSHKEAMDKWRTRNN